MLRAFLLACAAFTAIVLLSGALSPCARDASANGAPPRASDERLLFAFDPREITGTVHFQTALRIAALRHDREEAARSGASIPSLRSLDRRIARLEERLRPHLEALEARLAER